MPEPLPLNRSTALRGRDLRHAAIAALHRHGPMGIPELIGVLKRAGFEVAGAANKALADALRWETHLGRLQRVSRGHYATARLAATTRWRIMRRWHQAIGHFDPAVPGAYPAPRVRLPGGCGLQIRQWQAGTPIGNRLDR